MGITIHQVTGLKLFFIPVQTRLPLKFGSETLTSVHCLRVQMEAVDEHGQSAEGWGETPLSVQWVWPSSSPYEGRLTAMKRFCLRAAEAWVQGMSAGHPMEIGYDFQTERLPAVWNQFNRVTAGEPEASHPEPLPWLAALVCVSAFDLALHDAYGWLTGKPVYQTYGPPFLQRDLAAFLEPADSTISFAGLHPADYLLAQPARQLLAWHLVGGLDALDATELGAEDPQDGYPVTLTDWITRDGLRCLKIKLRGTDARWDYERITRVAQLAFPRGVECLSADFNCTVQHPEYVNQVLDQLRADSPEIFDRLLYVEQPFPYELEKHRINVSSVSARKPLFLDESAHDWRMVRLGRDLGWNGVALKTCKTQTGAILSACWARAHGLALMVQDLTNPMLAQIPHLLLAAHVGTIMGVETNSMQFYPKASAPEAKVHPGIYARRKGMVDLTSLYGPGFGYRASEIERVLPAPALIL